MNSPRIRVFCPCREQEHETTDVPNTLWNTDSLNQLEWLYYCDVCEAVRCPRCVEEEVVCRFCPSCLFEVTTASAKTDNNQCMRNCFQCPDCESSLSVGKTQNSPEDDEQSHSAESSRKRDSASGSSKDSLGKYVVYCNYCDYKSPIVFNKSTSLARQLAQIKNKSNSRYNELRQFYHSQAVEELTGTKSTKSTPSTVSEILESKSKSKAVEPGVVPLHNKGSEEPMHLPRFRRLACKKAKRCKGCRNMLIKPEPKPTNIKFKTKLLALNYVPSFRISPHFTEYPKQLTESQTYTFRLTVTSPVSCGSKVSLATSCAHKVTIITPNFELGPAPELWDEVSLVKGVPTEFIKRQTTASQKVFMEGQRETGLGGGLYERGQNWVTVLIEVVPTSEHKHVQIGLFTNFSYTGQLEEEEQEGPETDQGDAEHSVGFWTVLDLGETIPNPLNTGS